MRRPSVSTIAAVKKSGTSSAAVLAASSPVASLSTPMIVGPTDSPSVPIAITSAMPPAAPVPLKNDESMLCAVILDLKCGFTLKEAYETPVAQQQYS